MTTTHYFLTALISAGSGMFPTFGKGEPGRESGRPAIPRQSPLRWEEHTRTFLVQILVGLLAPVSQGLDA